MRTFRLVQNWTRRSSAIVFVDAVAAFYAAIRQMIIRVPTPQEELGRICGAVGLPEEATRRVWQRLTQPPAIAKLQLEEHLQAMISEAHRGVWFRYRGTGRSATLTGRGSRPGDPWGDYLYNLLMVEVLEEVSAAYERVGIKILYLGEPIQGWAGSPPEALAEATFMDDSALAVDGEDPDATLGRVRWAGAAVIDALSCRGIRVNLKRHKTAVLVSLRGQGATLALANLVGSGDG